MLLLVCADNILSLRDVPSAYAWKGFQPGESVYNLVLGLMINCVSLLSLL